MSTRAVFSFVDADHSINVYVHNVSSHERGMRLLVHTLPRAWSLPRFEADEFAAAFVATNKHHEGGVRLLAGADWEKCAPEDIEYRYVLWQHEKGLQLLCNCYRVSHTDAGWDMDKLWTIPMKTGATAMARVKEMENA